jgi:hypothetical protein
MFTLHRLIAGSLRRSNQARRRSSQQPARSNQPATAIGRAVHVSINILLLLLLPCHAMGPVPASQPCMMRHVMRLMP